MKITFQSLAVTLPQSLTFKRSARCLHCIVCFVQISEQTVNLPYTSLTNWFL